MSGETIPMGAGSAKALRQPQFGPQCGSQSGLGAVKNGGVGGVGVLRWSGLEGGARSGRALWVMVRMLPEVGVGCLRRF